MIRSSFALVLMTIAAPALALDIDALVAKHSAANGVPAHLVRRVIHIESRGNPHVISKGNYGLMQIRYGTAKAMGYTGTPQGLLDADTNMTYAVRYLAGAYRAANGDANRAVNLYQRGYYAEAKAKHFSPYAVASQTSRPVELTGKPAEKPAVELTVVETPAAKRKAAKAAKVAAAKAAKAAKVAAAKAAKHDKPVASLGPAAPAETTAAVAPDRPATLQERFAAAAPGKHVTHVKPVAVAPVMAAKPVAVVSVTGAKPVAVVPVIAPKPAAVVPAAAAKPVAPVRTAAPVEKVAVTAPAPAKTAVPTEMPAAVPAAMAVATPIATTRKPHKPADTIAVFSPQPVAQPEKFVSVSHPAASPTAAPAAAVSPAAVSPAAVPHMAVAHAKTAAVTPVQPRPMSEALAAVPPPDKPTRRRRAAKPDGKPFNLMSYLSTLVTPEKAAAPRQRRHRVHRARAHGTPMLSAATPTAQKP